MRPVGAPVRKRGSRYCIAPATVGPTSAALQEGRRRFADDATQHSDSAL